MLSSLCSAQGVRLHADKIRCFCDLSAIVPVLYFLIEAHTVFFFFCCFCFLLTQVRATTLGSRSGFRRTNAWLERTQFSGGSTRAVFMKLTLRGKQRV